MLKYIDTKVVFQEIPDEVTLAINISNCPCKCKGCHSPYLANNEGEPLTVIDISKLIKKNKGISCICFMGGDSSSKTINSLATWIKSNYQELKVAWYSGRIELSKDIKLRNFDYIKLGPYIEELGPLNSTSTNQRFYKVEDNKLVDITNKFWK